MILPELFHWSPADRYESIRTAGLVPFSRSTVASGEVCYICLSPTPSRAWGLSGDMGWASEVEEWDLRQVRLHKDDEVHIRPDFGPEVVEVKVHNPIAAERLWWVARRCHPASLRPEVAK